MKFVKNLYNHKNFRFFLVASLINLAVILVVYRSVFLLELQGDTWQYGWGYVKAFGDSLLTSDSFRNLQTSLAGSYLTFAIIEDIFGLSGLAYYTISVILKYFTVVTFAFFVFNLTKNKLATLISSILLSVSFVGIEATHWVFNMYAYVGMSFIFLGLTLGLKLPQKFTVRSWLLSFIFIALGVWWGPMRTTGVVIVILVWSLYKYLSLKTSDSRKNFIFWLISLPTLLFIYRSFLGLYEPAYTKYYIWDEWWRFFHLFISQGKYDFLLSPASNIARTIFPDLWISGLPIYEKFSPYFGLTNFRAVAFPLLLIYIAVSFFVSRMTSFGMSLFNRMFIFGFLWTAIVFLIYKLGPPNFPSWQELMFTLMGGYFLVWNLVFFTVIKKESLLRDLFLFAFFWSFSFVLTPIIQNGGNTFDTHHRYFVVTAAAVPLFLAGLLTEVSKKKLTITKGALIAVVFALIFLNATYTKRFFDFKAQAHNRTISRKIWSQFTEIVPNRPEYKNKNPIILFEAANNRLDKEIMFESLLFGSIFRIALNYDWNPSTVNGFYYENYNILLSDVSKDPAILNEFYAVRVENGNLIDITNAVKKDLREKIKEI